MKLEPCGSDLYLHMYDNDTEYVEPLSVNQIAHRQIGTHLKIPAAYYDRMQAQNPDLLAQNVNTWFEQEPSRRLVRTLGGTARAASTIWELQRLYCLSLWRWMAPALRAAK